MRFIDPDGKEKKLAVIGNEAIKKMADGYKDKKNVINIWVHGDSKGLVVMYQNGTTKDITDAKDFNKLLNDNSSTWRNKGENEQVTIVLHSCSTGKEEGEQNSFARRMSKYLKNTTIIAPNLDISVNKVTTNDNGKKTTEYKESIEDGNGNKGKWVEFKGGKETKRYESGSKPGSVGF